ncbi:MAG: glycosyltransferase family 4 protein [Pseudonocardia sp.]|nr:glycosyltransferase family 4 protein [Pseudonocardia sp.]
MTESALVISATSPVPVDTGKRAVLSGMLRYLVARLGEGNVHYLLVGADPESMRGVEGVVVHPVPRPSTPEQLRSVLRCVADRSYTLQEAMLGSPRLRSRISQVIDEVRPTLEVYDTLRLGQHAPAARGPGGRVLYVDDLFSVRYERMLAVAARGGFDMDPLGGFVDNIPRRLRPLARRPAVYLPLLRAERDRIRRREVEIVRHFDVSLLVNADEVDLLRERSGVSGVHTMTPLMPSVVAPPRAPATPPEFVFLGNLHLPHNDDAICHFVRTAVPHLRRRCPGAVVRVVGRNAGPALHALAAEHGDAVTLEGFVPDLDAVFSRATAVLAPLRFGSGVKIKMLEALARGVPLVATSVAAEGIPVDPHGADGCLVVDDIARWPEVLADLASGDRAAALTAGALAFWSRVYAEPVVVSQYDSLFGLSPAPVGGPARPASD